MKYRIITGATRSEHGAPIQNYHVQTFDYREGWWTTQETFNGFKDALDYMDYLAASGEVLAEKDTDEE
jgi:hypothetical protein